MARGKKTGGRVKGTPNKRTHSVLIKVATEGVTPLYVMLETMRQSWSTAEAMLNGPDFDLKAVDQMRKTALEAAHSAAPYVHPKLAPVDAKTGETARFVIIDPCN